MALQGCSMQGCTCSLPVARPGFESMAASMCTEQLLAPGRTFNDHSPQPQGLTRICSSGGSSRRRQRAQPQALAQTANRHQQG